jgi:hypothetical protein
MLQGLRIYGNCVQNDIHDDCHGGIDIGNDNEY